MLSGVGSRVSLPLVFPSPDCALSIPGHQQSILNMGHPFRAKRGQLGAEGAFLDNGRCTEGQVGSNPQSY